MWVLCSDDSGRINMGQIENHVISGSMSGWVGFRRSIWVQITLCMNQFRFRVTSNFGKLEFRVVNFLWPNGLVGFESSFTSCSYNESNSMYGEYKFFFNLTFGKTELTTLSIETPSISVFSFSNSS